MKSWSFGRKTVMRATEQREQIDLRNPRNAYYDNVSGIYHALFLIFLAALLVFSCVAMLCNLELFTYENFYFLAKDLGAASNLLSGSGNVINYESSAQNQAFTLYRGGLAVGGDSGLQLFTATGRETLNTSPDYLKPVLHGSEKYLLMYDIGEKRYSIYNSFVCLHHEETDYPVFAGAISDTGSYVIVSESYNHAGVVSLYNERFQLINRYNRTDMVTCADIHESGSRIAFATAGMQNSAYITTLVTAVPGEAETNTEMQIEGLFPYSITFIDLHRLLLVGDSAAYLISVDDGTVITPITYAGLHLAYADCNEDYTALVFSVNPVTDEYRIIILDKHGTLMTDSQFNANVHQVSAEYGYIFLLTDSGVVRIDPKILDYSSIECPTEGTVLLVRQYDEVVLCGGQSAVFYQFNK